MAERLTAAGVFTKEKDQSFLQQGVSEIGPAIVGPTVKGPALIPTQITTFSEFENIFGSYTEDSYVPHVVQDYLRNAGVINVIRLLYEDGYTLDNGVMAVVATSASVSYVTHVLHPTIPVSTVGAGSNLFEASVMAADVSGSFGLKISGSYAVDTAVPGFSAGDFYTEGTNVSGSILSTSNNYLSKIFGTSPNGVDYPVYVQYENNAVSSSFNNVADVVVSLVNLATFINTSDYNVASTPWVTSQRISGAVKNLFKFHTLSHGDETNHEVKIGIRDVRIASEISDPNGYGSFTVEVRRVNTTNINNSPFNSNDTDRTPDTVESFLNCNLDPDSNNYISRKIGDRYRTIDADGKVYDNGDYNNNSNFIRVEVANGVSKKTYNKELVPFGYKSIFSPVPNFGTKNLLAASNVTSQVVSGVFSNKTYFGFDFGSRNNLNYLSAIPTTAATTGSNADFYLGDVSQDSEAAFPSSAPYSGDLETALVGDTFTANIALESRKFIMPMQGGFDGTRPNLPKYSGADISGANTFGFDCSGAATTGTLAYKKAFAALSNVDFFDINMLVTPGIIETLHPAVTSAARDMISDRTDTFYVMDSNALTDNVATVVNTVTAIDSNYTATYWPWVRINDPSRNKPIWVPPSVAVPGAIAFNDSIAASWFAPAGLNRGSLTQVLSVYDNLTQKEKGELYQNRINPIANFPNLGICIWGQKNLQARPSKLDRVNVRRLLITVKKYIASSTKYLVFEQSSVATRVRFEQMANPYLESVRQQQGLSAFKVKMDSDNNTADLIDQNILYGQLWLQPTPTAEFIILDFNIQPSGATFDT